MRIECIEAPGSEWDRFVEAHPEGRLGHASAWARIFADAYRLEPCFLAARGADGELAGVLPLVVFRSRPGGRPALISLPFLDSAGVLAAVPEAGAALQVRATQLLTERHYGCLELREVRSAGTGGGPDQSMDRVNLALPLKATEESQWTALSAKVRNQCRKAEREGLSLRTGEVEGLRRGFLLPYQVNMRDIGSPPHSAAFFAAVARHFGERARFVVTEHAGRTVGGLVAIRFGRRVYVPWASTLRSERSRCPNNQIYWEAIRWAIASGASELDFGRSPLDGGTFRFKKGWGAVEEPLVWRRLDASGRETAQQAGTGNALVRKLSALWTRLPVGLASTLGARLRRYFSN